MSLPNAVALTFASFATGFAFGLVAVGHYCS